MKNNITKKTHYHYSRRLTSGLACETCRRRKTKCDGGQPCQFCSTNNIKCIHRVSSKRKKHSAPVTILDINIEIPSRQSSVSSSSSSTTPKSPLSLQEVEYHNVSAPLSTPIINTTKPNNNFNYKHRIPSITDQLSCHTFTIKTAYTL